MRVFCVFSLLDAETVPHRARFLLNVKYNLRKKKKNPSVFFCFLSFPHLLFWRPFFISKRRLSFLPFVAFPASR